MYMYKHATVPVPSVFVSLHTIHIQSRNGSKTSFLLIATVYTSLFLPICLSSEWQNSHVHITCIAPLFKAVTYKLYMYLLEPLMQLTTMIRFQLNYIALLCMLYLIACKPPDQSGSFIHVHTASLFLSVIFCASFSGPYWHWYWYSSVSPTRCLLPYPAWGYESSQAIPARIIWIPAAGKS